MENGLAAPDEAAAGSSDYMHLLGLVALGYMWAMMARKSLRSLEDGIDADKGFHEAKCVTARFFMERMLPRSATRLVCIRSGAAAVMGLDEDAF